MVLTRPDGVGYVEEVNAYINNTRVRCTQEGASFHVITVGKQAFHAVQERQSPLSGGAVNDMDWFFNEQFTGDSPIARSGRVADVQRAVARTQLSSIGAGNYLVDDLVPGVRPNFRCESVEYRDACLFYLRQIMVYVDNVMVIMGPGWTSSKVYAGLAVQVDKVSFLSGWSDELKRNVTTQHLESHFNDMKGRVKNYKSPLVVNVIAYGP